MNSMELVFNDIEKWDFLEDKCNIVLPNESGNYFVVIKSNVRPKRVECAFYNAVEKIWCVGNTYFNALIDLSESKNIEHVIAWAYPEIKEVIYDNERTADKMSNLQECS